METNTKHTTKLKVLRSAERMLAQQLKAQSKIELSILKFVTIDSPIVTLPIDTSIKLSIVSHSDGKTSKF
jgi:hypothetical protein